MSDGTVARRNGANRHTVALCVCKFFQFGLEAALEFLSRPGKERLPEAERAGLLLRTLDLCAAATHLPLKLGIQALHVSTILARPDFALRQYSMQFGAAQTSIIVDTIRHTSVTVMVDHSTTFSDNDAQVSRSEIKVGQRVVINAKPNADKKLVAVSIKWGAHATAH